MNKEKILKEYETNLMYCMDLLGSGEQNNINVDKICYSIFPPYTYVGCFPAEKFQKDIDNNQFFIINNQSSKQTGEHFIATYKYKNKFYMYDSFNRDVKNLSPYWKNIKNIISCNSDRDQSYTESNCSCRCISWLISAYKNTPTKIKNII